MGNELTGEACPGRGQEEERQQAACGHEGCVKPGTRRESFKLNVPVLSVDLVGETVAGSKERQTQSEVGGVWN